MDKTMIKKISCAFISLLCLSCVHPVWAWNQEISLGYGTSLDINHSKNTNSGFLLTGDFLPLKQKTWLRCSLNGSVGRWYSSTPKNKNLYTGALSLGLRFYLPQGLDSHMYLLVSEGPSYISTRKFGENNQGSNFAFQSILGGGIEMGRHLDLNLKFVHYSNAYLFKPNEGYNFLYQVSIGYLFS
jgi:hypothetical protein